MSSSHSSPHRSSGPGCDGHRGTAFGQPLTDSRGQSIDYGLDDMDIDQDDHDSHRLRHRFQHANSSDDDHASDSDGGDRIRRRRKPRKQFGDDEDDDDHSSNEDGPRQERSRRPGRGRGSAGAATFSSRPRSAQHPAPAASTTPGAGLGSSQHQPSVPKSFGQFAGTGGLGLKLLMKMGYTPGQGLGAQGQGIVEPVQAVIRPKGMGISIEEDYNESPAPKRKEDKGEADVSLQLDTLRFAKASKSDEAPREASRRTKAAQRRRNKYKKQKALEKEDAMDVDVKSTPTHTPMEIIDLRGESGSMAATSPYLSSPPVLHFLDSLAATATQTQSKLAARQAQRVADQAKFETVKKQLAEAKAKHQEDAQRLHKIRELADRIRSVVSAQGGGDDVWLDVVTDAAEFSSIFAPIMASLAVTKLRAKFTPDWDPIANPTLCTSHLARIRTCTSASLTPNGGTYYDSIVWALWIPRVRTYLQSASDWLTSLAASQSVVDALTFWTAHLSPALHAHVVHQVCVPRLRRALDTYSPSPCAPTLDSTVHPLLGFILPWFSSSLLLAPADTFLPGLTYKLGATIDYLLVRHPQTPANRLTALPPACIEPWQAHLSASAWSTLVSRHLVPAITAHVSECVRIDPASQDPSPVDALFAYIPLVGAAVVAQAMVDGGMFAAFVRVTYAWACAARDPSAGASTRELAAWWQVWRAYVPRDVWAEPCSKVYLGAGLMVLRAVARGEATVPDPEVLVPKAKAGERTSASVSEAAKTMGTGTSTGKSTGTGGWVPTIKDLVMRELEKVGLGIEAIGKTLARVGRPIYRIVGENGKRKATRAYVYWDQDVVFVRRSVVEGGVDESEDVVAMWEPVAVKEIVQMCQV